LPNRKRKTLTITVRRKSGEKNWGGGGERGRGGEGGIKAGQAILGINRQILSYKKSAKYTQFLPTVDFKQGFFLFKR
jgi:hypothetical protein